MKNPLNSESCLKSLVIDFADFRSKCRRNERFPDHLRRAVLEAIQSGLKPSSVSSALGVTSNQLKKSPLNGKKTSANPKAAQIMPRILQVVPSTKDLTRPNALRLTIKFGPVALDFSF